MRHHITPLLLLAALGGCGGGGGADHGERTDFVVSGVVTYDDRIYGPGPDQAEYRFLRTEAKPTRHATVQVVNSDGRVLAEATVGETGDYALAAAGGSHESMRLRVLAQTRTGAPVEIKDFAGNVVSVSKAFTPDALPARLDLAVPGEIAGAFNMLDVYTAAGEFVHEHHGEFPPLLSVYWQPGSTPPGGTTYHCRSCNGGIYVLGGVSTPEGITGDTDHFDDDVLLHEYGHFLEHAFGVLHSPGGMHTLLDNTQDLRLAWSEGFSSFMAGAIKAWLGERRHPTLSSEGLPYSGYVDTANGTTGPGGGLHYDFNTVPVWLDSVIRYASNETAVAKALWNLHAADTGMKDIWEVFATGLPAAAAAPDYPASLETFWDAWQASSQVAMPNAQAVSALAERHIHYSGDLHEADDTLDALLPSRAYQGAEDHNLFKAARASETDLIPFDADTGTRYRVETYDLINGAHTDLRITDGNGYPLAQQKASSAANAPNDGCALAARIDAFEPPYPGRFFVHVMRSSTQKPFAGRYGGYQLRITALSPSAPPVACP